MSGRVHSRELKMTIVRQLASGEKRPAQVCREHNLAPSVVSRWRNEYDQRGEEAFLPPATSEPPTAEAKIAEEEVYLKQYHTFKEASSNLGQFIDEVYNAKRLHSSLGYVPPSEFEAAYYQEFGC